MQRFFVDPGQISGDRVFITGNDVNHIKNVLRMKAGEQVRVSDGEKDLVCQVEVLESDQITLQALSVVEESTELPDRIVLFQGLPKSDKMELIIQKAVELGASQVVPVIMKRCVMKIEPKKVKAKTERWNAISESAAKQSKRMVIPSVSEPVTYKEALRMAQEMDYCLLPYENAAGMEGLRQVIGQIKAGKHPASIAILIGPEGGFDEAEVLAGRESGFQTVSLGRRILRTETAGMAMLSMLGFVLEP